MSSKLIGRVFDTAPYAGEDLLILVALADVANDEGIFWYSAASLARKCRLSSRQMYRYLAELEAAGILERQPRPGHSAVRALVCNWPDNAREIGMRRITTYKQSTKLSTIHTPQSTPDIAMSHTPDIAMSHTPDIAMSHTPDIAMSYPPLTYACHTDPSYGSVNGSVNAPSMDPARSPALKIVSRQSRRTARRARA